MRAVEAWAAGADPSLVRHWVFAVLAAVAPPYSAAFASSLIRRALLLTFPEIQVPLQGLLEQSALS